MIYLDQRDISRGSTAAFFERLSGHFEIIPMLLQIEFGHITVKDIQWDYDTLVRSINIVFYLLHFCD